LPDWQHAGGKILDHVAALVRILGVPPFIGSGTSAAQNGPLIETCTHCGAVNREHAEHCCSCDAPLAPSEYLPVTVSPPAPTEGNLAVETDWRNEVAHRLESYRARRRRPDDDDTQPTLPFRGERSWPGANASYGGAEHGSGGVLLGTAEMDHEHVHGPVGAGAAAAAVKRVRTPRVDRVEIAVEQPELDFSGVAAHGSSPWPRGARGGGAALPVAELGERWRAGLVDLVLLFSAFAAFLAMFRSFGGHFTFAKLDALVCSATLVLVCAQYFALFNVFGGTTPGMKLRGLRVVNFDGGEPSWRQLLWRSFGYVVSGGTVCLGFLWALWDEDHLTWQDRISKTYLTRVERVEAGVRASVPV